MLIGQGDLFAEERESIGLRWGINVCDRLGLPAELNRIGPEHVLEIDGRRWLCIGTASPAWQDGLPQHTEYMLAEIVPESEYHGPPPRRLGSHSSQGKQVPVAGSPWRFTGERRTEIPDLGPYMACASSCGWRGWAEEAGPTPAAAVDLGICPGCGSGELLVATAEMLEIARSVL